MKKNLKYIIAIILLILFTFSIVPKEFQNDTFYIIELGNQIEKTGVDWQDHWSIHDNLQYRYPHWLFDVINANINKVFGLTGIYVLTQIFASILIIIIFCNLIKKNVSLLLAFIGSSVVAYMMKGAFCARGQIISYSLFLIEYLILERFVQRPTLLKTLGLFVVSCLMANIHSTAWIMMLVLLLPFIGEQVVYLYSLKGINERLLKKYTKALEKEKAKDNPNQIKIEKFENEIKHQKEYKELNSKDLKEHKLIITKNPNVKWLWVAFVALVLGALVTPLKLTPILYFLKISVGNSMNYISEHFPIIIAGNLESFTYTAIMIGLLGFTNSKFKLSDAFLIFGLYIMTLSSRRNLFLLISLTACIIIKAIDEFIKSNMERENLKTAKIVFVIFCIASVGLSIYFFAKKANDEYISEKAYPIKATEYIKENLDYKNIRMYNGYDYGSYLLMEGVPVFLDSRCDLYTPEFNKGVTVFDDYMDVSYQKKTISDLMDKYDLEYAVVPVGQGEQVYMKEDSRYTELYKDKNFAVYSYDAK